MSSGSPVAGVGKPKYGVYEGGCHCGRVKFTMKLSPPVEDGPVTTCNCSICHKNGYLMVYPLNTNLEWHSGYDDMTSYTFGKEQVQHSFCSICGTSVCGKSNDANFFPDNTAINIRTLQGVELDGLKLRKIDGRSL